MVDELVFPVRGRGGIREQWLDNYAAGLRQMIDPATGAVFTDDQIARAIAPHGHAWNRADGIDAVSFLQQQRAIWLAAQARPDRAAGVTLRGEYVDVWELPYLPASGGTGTVSAPAVASTTFLGSTVLGDPAATLARDPGGRRYQNLFTEISPSNGNPVSLILLGLDTGTITNLPVGTKLDWINPPLGALGQATVTTAFKDGQEAETDAEYVPRLLRTIRHKQGAGNRAQTSAWAIAGGGAALARAYVYGCAFHAGTALVVPVAKRGATRGPLARIPAPGTMALVTTYLATVVPAQPFMLAIPPVPVATDMVIGLSLPLNSNAGWANGQPWPTGPASSPATIVSVTDQTHFVLYSESDLPPIDVPSFMVWDVDTSRFERLAVQTVVQSGPAHHHAVTLAAAPTHTLTAGDCISPWTELASVETEVIASTIEAYADSLGPGDVVQLGLSFGDDRAGFAFRWPKPAEEDPSRAGTGVLTYLQDALGAGLAHSTLLSIGVQSPAVPSNPIAGPGLIVLGTVAIYPF